MVASEALSGLADVVILNMTSYTGAAGLKLPTPAITVESSVRHAAIDEQLVPCPSTSTGLSFTTVLPVQLY